MAWHSNDIRNEHEEFKIALKTSLKYRHSRMIHPLKKKEKKRRKKYTGQTEFKGENWGQQIFQFL